MSALKDTSNCNCEEKFADIIQFPIKKKHGKSTKMECLYNNEEILAVLNVFKSKLDNAGSVAKESVARRNMCMFVCAINIGLRGGDFCSLKWSNIFDDNWNFLVSPDFVPQKTSHGKQPKHIELSWNSDFEKAIKEYLLWKKKNEYSPEIDDYIFTSQKGEHIGSKEWWRIMEQARKEAGIKQKIGTHGLRKTMAHQYIKNAENSQEALLEINEQFGHADLRTTSKYSCLAKENIRKNKERMAFIYS